MDLTTQTEATTLPATWPTFEDRPLADPTEPVVDQGLQFDVVTLLGRRQMLKLLGLTGVAAGIAACAPGAGSSASSAGSAAAATDAASCAVIPEETAGPYPGDGSNGPDILEQSGVVRSDIRSSFGTSTTTAEGVPLTIRMLIQDASDGCVPYAGAAVYAWHCDAEGRYSMYSQGVENENYLRGVQEADADGAVEFTSIFPACYQGRWPHIHFEVYPSLDLAIDAGNKIATSQIALPAETCRGGLCHGRLRVQPADVPAGEPRASDMVFGEDGGAQQLGHHRGLRRGRPDGHAGGARWPRPDFPPHSRHAPRSTSVPSANSSSAKSLRSSPGGFFVSGTGAWIPHHRCVGALRASLTHLGVRSLRCSGRRLALAPAAAPLSGSGLDADGGGADRRRMASQPPG